MRHILLASLLFTPPLFSSSATAALVFNEDFDGQVITASERDFIVFGGTTPEVAVNQWFSASNGVAIDNELQLTNFDLNRSRGAGIWLDSSGWTPGTVTVMFDILDYVAGGAGSESFFQAYFATSVGGSNSVSFDLHNGGSFDPQTSSTGSATIGTIGGRNTISANATQATYTFNFTDQANIALVFHNKSGGSDVNMPVFSVDNLSVSTVPEPSTSILLLGTGVVGLLLHCHRRAKLN